MISIGLAWIFCHYRLYEGIVVLLVSLPVDLVITTALLDGLT